MLPFQGCSVTRKPVIEEGGQGSGGGMGTPLLPVACSSTSRPITSLFSGTGPSQKAASAPQNGWPQPGSSTAPLRTSLAWPVFLLLRGPESWEPDDDPTEEHGKHSARCAFLSVKKQLEELTLSEFLKPDKERAKNKIVKSS